MEDTEKKTGTAGKIQKLQKQYNTILVDLFKEHGPTAIEDALGEVDGPIGQNIDTIIQSALDSLKGKVMEDLGMSTDIDVAVCDGPGPMGLGGVVAISDGDDDTGDTEAEDDSSDADDDTEAEANVEDEDDDKD